MRKKFGFFSEIVVYGNGNTPLFLLKPETKDHYIYQQSHKSPLLFFLQRPPNSITYNCFNCLFLTIWNYCALCKFQHLGHHKVNWTNCSVTAALKTIYGALPLPRVPRVVLELNTRQSQWGPWWQHTLVSFYLTELKRERVQRNNWL